MVKKLLVLAWLFPVSAFRADLASQTQDLEENSDPYQWAAHPAIHLGQDPNGPLIPDLVPPAGEVYTLENRERFDIFESNRYVWEFASRGNSVGESVPVGQRFAELEGSFFGNFLGARRTTVRNTHGHALFHIELAKNVWNPTRLHWSFRIRHPLTNEILFTINKDIFGGGFLWIRDEWRVYRGQKRDANQLYYIVGGYVGYEHQFFKTKTDWRRGENAVGRAYQSVSRNLMGVAPEVYSVTANEGEDAALLLATSVIINMVHETEARQRAAASADENLN